MKYKLILIGAFIILLFIGYKVFFILKNIDFAKAQISKANTEIKVLSNAVLQQSQASSLPNKYFLDLALVDLNENKVGFKDILKSGNKIIYRVSEVHCMDCIQAQFPFFQMLSEKLNKEHAILLASFSELKNFKIFIQKYKLEDFQCYNIDATQLLQLPIETLNTPYFFTINERELIQNVFIPIKEFPDLSKNYSNYIFTSLKTL